MDDSLIVSCWLTPVTSCTLALQVREKQFRLKMLAEMPRRTSDRIALKAAQKAEQVSCLWCGRVGPCISIR